MPINKKRKARGAVGGYEGYPLVRVQTPDQEKNLGKALVITDADGGIDVISDVKLTPSHWKWDNALFKENGGGHRILVCSQHDEDAAVIHENISVAGQRPTGNCDTCPHFDAACRANAFVFGVVKGDTGGEKYDGEAVVRFSQNAFVAKLQDTIDDDFEANDGLPSKAYHLKARDHSSSALKWRTITVVGEPVDAEDVDIDLVHDQWRVDDEDGD